MYFKKTSQRLNQAKEIPEHMNPKECLNMYNINEYAFDQCNEKVYQKVVLS